MIGMGDRISLLLDEKGMTQHELARQLKVADNTVSRWILGKGEPRCDLLCAIAGILGSSTDYLLGRCGPLGRAYLFPAIRRGVREDCISSQLAYISGEVEEARKAWMGDKSCHVLETIDELNDVIISAETAKRMIQYRFSWDSVRMEKLNMETVRKNAKRGYWEGQA